MRIFRLHSIPIGQVLDLDGFERRLGAWFTDLDYPVRLIAVSNTFDMQAPVDKTLQAMQPYRRISTLSRKLLLAIKSYLDEEEGAYAHPSEAYWALNEDERDELHAELAHLGFTDELFADPDNAHDDLWALLYDELRELTWPLRWLDDRKRFYETLQQRFLRLADYYLITWEPPETNARTIQQTLRRALGRPVEEVQELPPIIRCDYTEQWNGKMLTPEVPGRPLKAVLTMHDARGAVDATWLHPLMALDFDVAISIDIFTLSRQKARRAAELAYSTSLANLRGGKGGEAVKDVRGEDILGDAERVMREANTSTLHDAHVAVLVSGMTPSDLETNIAEAKAALGNAMKLTLLPGVQGELLKLFGSTPLRSLEFPANTRNMLSHGVGCLAGVTTYHRRGDTNGLFWGVDAIYNAPLFFDLFENNQAAHAVVLGKTGYGKTFFLNLLTIRAATDGYRVITLDAFRNAERLVRGVGVGVNENWVGPESAVNPLDVVYADSEEDVPGSWLRYQIPHVIGQLALLFGRPSYSGGKEELVPYDFSQEEQGILGRALLYLYEGVSPDDPPTSMPILSDLIKLLREYNEPEARALARKLQIALFGGEEETRPTPEGEAFNTHSQIRLDFTHDINCIDLSRVPERWRPFYYLQVIGAVQRFMRDPSRDLSRRTFLLIDEFHYVTKVAALAQLAAEICKVARKYRIALIAVDQNPVTFIGNDNGRFIIDNTRSKFMFHLDPQPAREMTEVIEDLSEGHIDYVTHAGVGECLAVFDHNIYAMNVEPSQREYQVLAGS